MSLLPALKDLCELIDPTNETEEVIDLEQIADSELLSTIFKKVTNIYQINRSTNIQLEFTLSIPDIQDAISLQFSQSFTKIEIEQVSDEMIEYISVNEDIPIIQRLNRVYEDNEIYSISDFVSDLDKNLVALDDADFTWSVSVCITKKPFEDEFKTKVHSNGLNADVAIFVSGILLLRYLESNHLQTLYNKIISKTGNLVIGVGDIDSTLTGSYLLFTNLWEIRDDLLLNKDEILSFHDLKQKHDFLIKIASPLVVEDLVVPEFCRINQRVFNDYEKNFFDLLQILELYNMILTFSSYASYNKDGDDWIVRIVGSKTIQSTMILDNKIIFLDGSPVDFDTTSFRNLYNWAFSDLNHARVSLTRRTISLHTSSFSDLIIESKRIKMSAEAAFDLFLDEKVSEILEINQRFTEYSLDWTVKDIELKMKLRDVFNDTALGGLGSIIGAIIGISTQSFQPDVSSLILFIVPVAFFVYLMLLIIRLDQMNETSTIFIDQHEKQLDYYQRILGKEVVNEITGAKSSDDLKKEFKGKKRNYQIVIAIAAGITLIIWLYWLLNGYITLN